MLFFIIKIFLSFKIVGIVLKTLFIILAISLAVSIILKVSIIVLVVTILINHSVGVILIALSLFRGVQHVLVVTPEVGLSLLIHCMLMPLKSVMEMINQLIIDKLIQIRTINILVLSIN